MKRFFLLSLILMLVTSTGFAQSKSKEVQRLEKERQEALKEVEKTDRQLKKVSNDRYKKQKAPLEEEEALPTIRWTAGKATKQKE